MDTNNSQPPAQASSSDHDLLVRLDEKVNTIIQSQQTEQKVKDNYEIRLRAVEKVQETTTGESKGKTSTRDVLLVIVGLIITFGNPFLILWLSKH